MQSDFKYFAENQEDINNSINREAKHIFSSTLKSEENKKFQEFGEFGTFKSPKSKFSTKVKKPNHFKNETYIINGSSEEDTDTLNNKMMSNGSKEKSSSSNLNGPTMGPRIRRTEPRVFEKFDNSSVHIYKSEFKSNDNSNSTSKVGEFRSESHSKESEHLKVEAKFKGRSSQPETRDKSRDSLSSLKGSMLSEIFCLDTKKKKVPLSKFSQKMRKNSKYINMVNNIGSVRKLGTLKSEMISRTTLSEIDQENGQINATLYFFKALIRLSKIFLEKLKKPKHSLKCLIFLEKNHQVESFQITQRQSETKQGMKKKMPYLRINASSDSIEDYIRETQNKVNNLYSPNLKKTHLNMDQASSLFFLLGKTYLALNDHSKAEEKFVLSHVYDKSNFESLFMLAEMNMKIKNYKRAERYYRKAHYNNCEDNRAIYGIADCNIREKNFDFLAQFAKSLDFEILTNPRICLLFAVGLLRLLSKSNLYPTNHNKELYFTLIEFLKRAEQCLLLPNSVDSYHTEVQLRNQIAQKYFKIKEFQSGINCLNHLDENSMTPITLYNLAYAHYKTGNLSHSMAFLRRILVVKPHHMKSLLLKAEISKKKGDLKVAQSILQKLIETNPLDPVINKMLGDIFKHKGSFFQAIEHYEVRL
jgi:tetratricopeptide (TPR) repeat protein